MKESPTHKKFLRILLRTTEAIAMLCGARAKRTVKILKNAIDKTFCVVL